MVKKHQWKDTFLHTKFRLKILINMKPINKWNVLWKLSSSNVPSKAEGRSGPERERKSMAL